MSGLHILTVVDADHPSGVNWTRRYFSPLFGRHRESRLKFPAKPIAG
jgi:hypothetical protein